MTVMYKRIIYSPVIIALVISLFGFVKQHDSEHKANVDKTMTPSFALEIYVTDVNGVAVKLTNVNVFDRSTLYSPPKITYYSGFAIMQSSAKLDVSWNKIDSIVRISDSNLPIEKRNIFRLTLKTGKNIEGQCAFDYISGNTDLGKYELWSALIIGRIRRKGHDEISKCVADRPYRRNADCCA